MALDIHDIPVRIVLCAPTHPGNIGASARAMKTMGLHELVLVAPRQFPSAEAIARASGAGDLLDSARVVATLAEAIDDCAYVVGASARLRSLDWPTMDPRVCARHIVDRAADSVAIVFGPEHSGLDNDALARCQALVHIPANPAYSSLNLAMAVQVICYELLMARLEPRAARAVEPHEERDAPLATSGELDAFHEHLEAVMIQAGFLNPNQPRMLKRRLRRLFNRARLDRTEINILRGLLAAVERDGTEPGAD